MVVFMGVYSSNRDDSEDEASEDSQTDEQTQSTVDDYSEEETEDVSEDKDSDDGGTGAGGAPGPGGSSGTGAGGGGVAESVEDSPEEGDSEDGDDSEDTPEESEPDSSPDDHEVDRDASEDGEDPEDRDDREDSQDEQEDEEEEDEEDEEEEDDTVLIYQEVDPLSAMSWGVQPVMKKIKARYGDQVEIVYKPASVREFDNPEQEKQQWLESMENHDMPVSPAFWETKPPESTALVNKGFKAATRQGQTAAESYLRRLWMHAIAGGQAIDGQETLVDLAADSGLDIDRFTEALGQLTVADDGKEQELPFTVMDTKAGSIPRTGRLHYTDCKAQFLIQGLDEEAPPEPADFVSEHGPVATVEVSEVCEFEDREAAINQLRDMDSVVSFELGGEIFWEYQN